LTDFEHGPVDTYEITWMSGHIEQVLAHQVSYPQAGMAMLRDIGMLRTGAETGPARIRMHAQIDGRWTLTLSAREEDIRTIRLVTVPEHVPGSDGAR
jgi:hypothetical protein